jgi:hypothetical protein
MSNKIEGDLTHKVPTSSQGLIIGRILQGNHHFEIVR